jgi:hypothetical protein
MELSELIVVQDKLDSDLSTLLNDFRTANPDVELQNVQVDLWGGSENAVTASTNMSIQDTGGARVSRNTSKM